jgi:CHAD domain-containing protein
LELRWFTAQLGDARNLDVYLERQLPDEERGSLTGMREQTYDRVIEAMNSQRQRDLMLDLVGWIALGDWQVGQAGAAADRALCGKAPRTPVGDDHGAGRGYCRHG